MTHLTASRFTGDADLAAMHALLTTAADPHGAFWHPGDLIWGLYQSPAVSPYRTLRLWRNERGTLAGFAQYHLSGYFEWQIAPPWRGQGTVEATILRWATTRHARQVTRGEHPGPLTTVVSEGDHAISTLLHRHGFAPLDQWRLLLHHPLTDDLPPPILPSGFTLRAVREDELAARVALHRAVWHPSRVTLPAYRRLRATAGYDADLDLVAVAPGGTLAAYCICWHDPINQTGLFEPLGTAAAYRRLGLGQAIVREGWRRLAARGARVALVAAESVNPAACALYEAAGFQLAGRQRYYARTEPTD